MAVAKPSTVKKKTTTKKPATKKPVAKETAAKKPTAKKTTAKKMPSTELRSFRLCRETENFISVRFTRQTIYWTIIAAALLIVGLMSLNAQINIMQTLNEMSESVRQ